MADSGRPGIAGGGEHETASIVDGAGLLEDGDGFIAERDAVFGFVRPSCRVFTLGPVWLATRARHRRPLAAAGRGGAKYAQQCPLTGTC